MLPNTHCASFLQQIYIPCSSTQEVVFDVCVREIVESVLQGYNGSVIASGQTSMLSNSKLLCNIIDSSNCITLASVLPFEVYHPPEMATINRYYNEMLTIQQDIGYQISSGCTPFWEMYVQRLKLHESIFDPS